MKDIKKMLELRNEMKQRRPHFKRHDRNKLGRLARSGWRKSVQGHDNKQRNRYAGNEKSPTPGYGSPANVRGMHPSGFHEVIIHNIAELNGVDAKVFAVRVSRTVGNRKKTELVEYAKKLNFKVLNPAYFQLEKQKAAEKSSAPAAQKSAVKSPKADKKTAEKKDAEEKTQKESKAKTEASAKK